MSAACGADAIAVHLARIYGADSHVDADETAADVVEKLLTPRAQRTYQHASEILGDRE